MIVADSVYPRFLHGVADGRHRELVEFEFDRHNWRVVFPDEDALHIAISQNLKEALGAEARLVVRKRLQDESLFFGSLAAALETLEFVWGASGMVVEVGED